MDDDFEQRLMVTENKIQGLSVDVSKIRSGEGLSQDILNNYKPPGSNSLSKNERLSHNLSKPRKDAISSNRPSASKDDEIEPQSIPLPVTTKALSPSRKAQNSLKELGRGHLPRESPVSNTMGYRRIGDMMSSHEPSPVYYKDPQSLSRRGRLLHERNDVQRESVCSSVSVSEDEMSPSRLCHSERHRISRFTAPNPSRHLKQDKSHVTQNNEVSKQLPSQSLRDLKLLPSSVTPSRPITQCELGRVLDRQQQQEAIRLTKQAEWDIEERVQAETEKLRKEMNNQIRSRLHALEVENIQKLNTLRVELEREKELHQSSKETSSKCEEQLEIEIDSLKQQLHDAKEQCILNEQELAAAYLKIDRLERGLNTIETEKHVLQKAHIALLSKHTEIEKELRTESNSKGRLECDVDHAQSQLMTLSNENTELKDALTEEIKQKSAIERHFKTTCDVLKETEDKLKHISSSYFEVESRLNDINRDFSSSQLKIIELEKMLQKKSDTEANGVMTIEELREREHRLKSEVNCYAQRLAEKKDLDKDMVKLKREIEILRKELSEGQQDAMSLKNEIKILTNSNDKAAIEIKKYNNDVLSLKQENMKLKKLLHGYQSHSIHNPITGQTHIVDQTTKASQYTDVQLYNNQDKKKHEINSNISKSHLVNLRTNSLAAGKASMSYPLEWEYKPPDNIPLYGGGGGLKTPSIIDQEIISTSLPNISTTGTDVPHQSSTFIGSMQKLCTDGLEKQLMLLQMEKNQIDSDLTKFPSGTRGRTMKERIERTELESRYAQLDTDIHKIRQELRLSGTYRSYHA